MHVRQGELRREEGTKVTTEAKTMAGVSNSLKGGLHGSDVAAIRSLRELLPTERGKPSSHVMPNSSPRAIVRSLVEPRMPMAGGERGNTVATSTAMATVTSTATTLRGDRSAGILCATLGSCITFNSMGCPSPLGTLGDRGTHTHADGSPPAARARSRER